MLSDAFGVLSTAPTMQAFLEALALATTDADIVRFMRWHAVLFTDLSGFSAHPVLVEALRRVLQFEKALQALVDGGGGRVLKALGDSCLVLYETADQAVAAVDKLHAALPDNPFCAGIGYGPMVVCHHHHGRMDAFGFEVSAASRLGEDVAAGRQCLLTSAAHGALSTLLQQRCLVGASSGIAYWELCPTR